MNYLNKLIKSIKVFFANPFYRDVSIIIVVATALFFYAAENDFFEWLVDYSREHEEWELDEVFVFLMLSAVAFLAILFRNAGYLKREMAHRRQAEKQIKKLAYYDSLTGLPKRELCEDRLKAYLSRDKRVGLKTAVIFLDLDNFKDVNDSYGHQLGDDLLVAVTKRLSSRLRGNDMLARFAGDEFVMIIESVKSSNDISVLSSKITSLMSTPFMIRGIEIHTSLSLGIAISPTDGVEVETLYHNADAAMYQAKLEGKGTYRFFSKALDRLAKNKLQLRNCLSKALERKEFTLLYQPLINISDGKIAGCEALIRWKSEEFGHVSPDIFIPIAEESGFISDIGRWVFREACTNNKSWQIKGHKPIIMSVNMSSRELINEHYVEDVMGVLKELELSTEYLELELTETSLMNNVEDSLNKLTRLDAMGVAIVLDDFGTGFSSLEHLRRFELKKIKVDRSFVRNIPGNNGDVRMTKAIVYLGYCLGLKVTAEGIETKEQLEVLRETNCDTAQGYLFSKPVSEEEFEKLLIKDESFYDELGISYDSKS